MTNELNRINKVTFVFYNNKLKWSSEQGLDEEGIVGLKRQEKLNFIQSDGIIVITFLALPLVNNKIQEISLAQNLTV